jgi:hypothetical protein
MPTCEVKGCKNPVNARGWCKLHYTRVIAARRQTNCAEAGEPEPVEGLAPNDPAARAGIGELYRLHQTPRRHERARRDQVSRSEKLFQIHHPRPSRARNIAGLSSKSSVPSWDIAR